MKSRRNAGLHSRLTNRILTDRGISDVVSRVNAMFSPAVRAMAKRFGGDVERTIRLSLLGSKCRERRCEIEWTLKQAAEKVGVPRYRIEAIESPAQGEFSQKEIRLYVKALRLQVWFRKWEKANRRAFASIAVEPPHNTPWAKRVRGTIADR